MIFAQMGDIESSFEWLEKAYKDQESEMFWLKVDPPFSHCMVIPAGRKCLTKLGFLNKLGRPLTD